MCWSWQPPQAPKCGQKGSMRFSAGATTPSNVPRSPSRAISTRSPGRASGTKTLRPSISATPSPLWPRLVMVAVMVMVIRGLLNPFSSGKPRSGLVQRPAGPFEQAGQTDKGHFSMLTQARGTGAYRRDPQSTARRHILLGEAGGVGVEFGHEQALVTGIATAVERAEHGDGIGTGAGNGFGHRLFGQPLGRAIVVHGDGR